jgi:NTE family protein
VCLLWSLLLMGLLPGEMSPGRPGARCGRGARRRLDDRCGATLAEITAWQRGNATGELSASAALAAQEGPLPPLPCPRPGSLPLACAALALQVPPWVGASGWLPHGRARHTALRSLVSTLQERREERRQAAPGWADGRTWIAAMDYDRGGRGVFGPPGAPPAPLTDAVTASCSIPGWYAPAVIGGRRYVDGGIRSGPICGSSDGSGT